MKDNLGREYEHTIDREEFPYIYGRTVFKDGPQIPFMKLCEGAQGGAETRLVDVHFGRLEKVIHGGKEYEKFKCEYVEKRWKYLHYSALAYVREIIE